VELLVNLSESYKTMNESDKLYLINIILVELVVDKEKTAFIKEKPLFQFIRKCLNPIWWNKKDFLPTNITPLYKYTISNPDKVNLLYKQIKSALKTQL
jgi:hypothetical protein